jgi:hypothetical protein
MTSIDDLLIVGVLVSLLVQYLKSTLGTREYVTLGIVAALSILGAGLYVTVKDTRFWPTLLEVLKWAGAIYSFIILRFEGKTFAGGAVKDMFR